MTGSEIRKTFLDYFAARGHRVVRSSSLVPANDPTLLFTNAGMNQFKDVFLGLDHRDYARAASSQKCMRAGGKHNDLENVGRTRRHLTFFEMLGNFSFGDYFKKEAIEYAWELVTKVYGIPHDRLYITVFREDDEALDLWTSHAGVSAERGFRMDEKDNFWAMGDTGPCGPCSEIHYDLGAPASDWGHADCKFPCECGRYVEIWNLVFMQYNRDASGKLTPLPKPSVDTGMGLERMASVLQGKLSVFETDLLFALVEEAAEMAGVTYGEQDSSLRILGGHSRAPELDVSLRILADHSRAATFLIHDGILPANDGRGYVLRKVLRRAVRHGRYLGLNEPFLYKLAGKVAEIMSDAFPELLESTQRVAAVVKSEEQRFAHTMMVALQEFDKVAKEAKSASEGLLVSLPGDKLFRLYDTFGMPLDWIKEIAGELHLGVDENGFEQEMARQRERSRASWKGVAKEVLSPVYAEVLKNGRTVFEGYQQTTSANCKVIALLVPEGHWPELLKGPWKRPWKIEGPWTAGRALAQSDQIPAGMRGEVVLDHTPFYAEAGGQVGDEGVLRDEETQEIIAEVEETYYPVSGVIAHVIVSRVPIRVGDKLTAVVDAARREATKRNHTATHLLHAALRQVLGTHVKQAGSVVEPGRLRFDFSHFASVSEDELQEIEKLANDEIVRNIAVETATMDLDQALETGAMAFFGEKYPDRVRVVAVPGFSKELCGGTHVSRTGDIGLLKITHEGSISAGVRRVEAITGQAALEHYQQVTTLVRNLAGTVKAAPDDLPEVVEKLVESQRNLEKQLESLKLKLAQSQLADLESRVKTVKDVKVLAIRLDALERNQMRTLADSMRQKLQSGVVVLGSASDGKVALIAALTSDLTKRLHAGKIAQAVAQKLGGTGGGRPDMAEGGGKDLERLDDVLNEVYDIIGAML